MLNPWLQISIRMDLWGSIAGSFRAIWPAALRSLSHRRRHIDRLVRRSRALYGRCLHRLFWNRPFLSRPGTALDRRPLAATGGRLSLGRVRACSPYGTFPDCRIRFN